MKFSLPPTKNFLCSQEMIPNMTENIQQAVQFKVNQNLWHIKIIIQMLKI